MMNTETGGARSGSGAGMYSKALLVLSGNAGSALLTLLRNLLVARLIAVEDYGIAATFAVVMALVEMITAFGLQQQIIQSKQGDDPRWQAALQGFQVARGVLTGVALFFAAGPIAGFLGVPEVTWAYQVMALPVIFNSLMHMDIWRLNRAMIYLPGVLTHTVPALISLLLVWPLWLVFGDYQVMLWAIIAQAALQMGMSHLVARRRYGLSLEREIIARAVSFGWPLLINNVLLFLVMNGEKMVVGREIGMAALAVFAMGFTLTLTPTLVLAKSVQSFFLPQLSAVQDEDARFQPLARTTIAANLVNGMVLVLGIVLVGEPFVTLVLGEKYAALVPLMSFLAILQGLRVFKAGAAVSSLARAKTENAMVSNLWRVAVLPIAWWAAVQTGDLMLVIFIAGAGEFLGVITAMVLVRVRAGVRLGPLLPAFGLTALCLLAAAGFGAQPLLPGLSALPRWPFAAACGLFFAAALWSMTDLRSYLRARAVQRHES